MSKKKPFRELSSRHQRRIIKEEVDFEQRMAGFNGFFKEQESWDFGLHPAVSDYLVRLEEELEQKNSSNSNEEGEEVDMVGSGCLDSSIYQCSNPETSTGMFEVFDEDVLITSPTNESFDPEPDEGGEMDRESEIDGWSDIEEEFEGTEDEELTEDNIFLNDLKDFCLTHLADSVTDKLLKMMKPQCRLASLPTNHKHLLGDLKSLPRPAEISGGHFLYLGIRLNLRNISPSKFESGRVVIDISYDGVRLHKASKTSLWPIVMSFPETPVEPVKLLGVFIGLKSKLSVNEFFFCLKEEIQQIHEDDCSVEVGKARKKMPFKCRLFVSDTPAKSFALGNLLLL